MCSLFRIYLIHSRPVLPIKSNFDFEKCVNIGILFKRNISDVSTTINENQLDSPQTEGSISDNDLAVEKLRDKSRLRQEHRNILFDCKPHSMPVSKHHLSVKYNRKLYGKYGSVSGVNPGIMWPTKVDLQLKKEYESIAYPFTIQTLISLEKEKEEMVEKENQRIHDRTLANFAKLDQWKTELKEKLAKKEADALAVKKKKEKLIEEVRRHFGFTIDPRDERFKEMLMVKEKEQKKMERQAKLQERERKAIAKLMAKNESHINNTKE